MEKSHYGAVELDHQVTGAALNEQVQSPSDKLSLYSQYQHKDSDLSANLSDKETDSMLLSADKALLNNKLNLDIAKHNLEVETKTYHQIDLNTNTSPSEKDIGLRFSSIYSVSKLSMDTPVSQTQNQTARKTRSKYVEIFYSVLDLDLLSNRATVMYLLCFVLCYSYMYFITYIPSLAEEMGLERSKASILVAIYGFVDILAKMGFGLFADTHLVRTSRIIAYTALAAGGVCFLVKMYASYWHFVVFVVVFGMMGPTSYTLNTSLIVESVGERHLGKLLAMSMMFATILSSVTLPVQGQYLIIF